MAALKDQLAGPDPVVECARCRQAAMRLDEGAGARCLFCLDAPAPEDAADQYVSEVIGLSQYVVAKEGGSWPVEECPECRRDALVEGVDVPGRAEIRWECFACGHWARSGSLARCTRCGDLTSDDTETCRRCWDHLLASD